jgi:hypothetical protein
MTPVRPWEVYRWHVVVGLGYAFGGSFKRHAALVTTRAGGKGRADVLILGMIVLGLASFAAMLAFVELCDRV